MKPSRALTFAALLGLAATARAVIVAGGDGTQNTTAPAADDFGFANVARVWNSANGFYNSGVYLGHGWVLTAYHVVRDGTGGFLFRDVIFRDSSAVDHTFTIQPGSGVRLRNADDSFTDLALFHLDSEPAFLGSIAVAATTPLGGESVVLAGFGVNRSASETHWDVSGDTWTETTNAGNAQGYQWAGGQSLRWGTNTLAFGATPSDRTTVIDDGFGLATSIATSFENLAGEAQGAVGDSGGGLFHKSGATWELAGILTAIDTANGQPANTAVFGNATYAVDLATYRDQIVAVVPEPTSAVTLALSLATLGARRWRRRSRGVSFLK